ncbi:hypothetical protein DL769_007707 [Monosporascus sp. CRB-8-3]|nr:hypothetical protein DL769_007707 [Monosporascus sp. CRB-8-3]
MSHLTKLGPLISSEPSQPNLTSPCQWNKRGRRPDVTDGPTGSTRDRGYADDRRCVPADWRPNTPFPDGSWTGYPYEDVPGVGTGAVPRASRNHGIDGVQAAFTAACRCASGTRTETREARRGSRPRLKDQTLLFPGEIAVGQACGNGEYSRDRIRDADFLPIFALLFPGLGLAGAWASRR